MFPCLPGLAKCPPMLKPKIPATVVTGFLGAGKTSLVRCLLENAGGRRLALVVNEFGDLGVDGEILRACGIEGCEDEDIVELANGCICCTVADDFLPTMRALLDRPVPPDHIVIETSGLALPKPLVQAFAWPEVRSRATVDGVIAVVDAAAVAAGRFAADPEAVELARLADPALDHDAPLEELFEDQLSAADLVVVNKRDLLDAPAWEGVLYRVRAGLRSPAVKTVGATQGAVDTRLLLGLEAAAEDDLDARPSHHDSEDGHDHDDFESFAVEAGPVAPATLTARMADAARTYDVLRIKGFAAVEGKAMRLAVQGVGARAETWYDRPWRPGEELLTRLVVIGFAGLDREAVAQTLGGRCIS